MKFHVISQLMKYDLGHLDYVDTNEIFNEPSFKGKHQLGTHLVPFIIYLTSH